MSAISAALAQIDDVADEGDLKPDGLDALTLESAGEAVELPDGKVVYPPSIHGEPLHELATRLLDTDDPQRSRFLRLIGPPGTGKSQVARAIAHTLWLRRGRAVETRFGAPFYGFVEMQLGPSSDEWTFRHEFVPFGDAGHVKLIDSAFVQAMRNGWMVMLDEVNVARDSALLSINGTIDGRLSLYLPATGETVTAAPGFCLAPGVQQRPRGSHGSARGLVLAVPCDGRGAVQLARAHQAGLRRAARAGCGCARCASRGRR
jgi:hypothetical protein